MFCCPNRYELRICSAVVANTPVGELNVGCLYGRLARLVGVAAVGELNQRLLIAARVLGVGVAAIEKCGHGLFNQAGSGPRSMA